MLITELADLHFFKKVGNGPACYSFAPTNQFSLTLQKLLTSGGLVFPHSLQGVRMSCYLHFLTSQNIQDVFVHFVVRRGLRFHLVTSFTSFQILILKLSELKIFWCDWGGTVLHVRQKALWSNCDHIRISAWLYQMAQESTAENK